MPNNKGVKNSSFEEIEQIVNYLRIGVTQEEICGITGRSSETVSRIYRNWLGDYRELLKDCKTVVNFLTDHNSPMVAAKAKGLMERIDIYFTREKERKDGRKKEPHRETDNKDNQG